MRPTQNRGLRVDLGDLLLGEFFEVGGQGLAVVFEDVLQRDRGHELDEPVVAAEDDHVVDGQAQVDAHRLQNEVHQRNHLHDDLVSAQVVRLFVNDLCGLAAHVAELDQHRLRRAAEDVRRAGHQFLEEDAW